MVATEALEGTVNQKLWYHYDFANDVLYLRLLSERSTETAAEETPEGILLLRRLDDDEIVGLTVVNWWKRFGEGGEPDSIRRLEHGIERTSAQLTA